MEKLKIGVIQMVSSTDLDQNLASAARLMGEAVDAGAQWLVLPEYFCLMGQNDRDKVLIREPFGTGKIQDFLADFAQKNGIWLFAGTLPLVAADKNRVRNSVLVYTPEGKLAARYDKIHLFRFSGVGESYNEADSIEAGNQIVSLSTPWGEVALAVCYDLRFPEMFRQKSVDFWIIPAAFTQTTGEAHWEILLRARAIENQCFVIAAAQGGLHANGRQTFGHSMIIDPWGKILAQHDQGEGVVLADISLQKLRSVRTHLPALSHRVF